MGNTVGSIDLGLNVNAASFNRQLNGISNSAEKGATKSFGGLGSKIGMVLGIAAVASFTKSCLTLGSNLTEVENVVDTAFPGMSNQIDSFAANAMNQFGLSETVAKKYMGTLGAMSESMGFTEKASYDMAAGVTGLAGDVASFYNTTNDEAYTKLKSIWTGETESLKEIGVVMTQTNLDNYALNNGFGKTTATMTEQQKVALRYAYVMSALGLAQGDFAKTSGSWANQTRILSTQFDALKASIGQGLINVFTPVINLVNVLLGGLSNLAKSFALFTTVLTGGINATSSTGSALADIAGNAVDAAANVTGLGDATASSAKVAAKALAGFDQITKIGDVASSDASGGSSAGSTSSATTPATVTAPDTTGAENAVAKLMSILEPLRNINFDPLMAAFSNLGDSASKVAGTLWDALGWAYTNILVPLATWTIQDFLPAFLDVTAGALDVFNSTLVALQPLWQWAWDSFLQPLAAWTGGAIVSVLGGTTAALKGVSGWIDKNQGAVRAMAVTVGIFVAAWKVIGILAWADGVKVALKSGASLMSMFSGVNSKMISNRIECAKLTVIMAKDFVVGIAKSIASLATSIAKWIANTAAMVASTAATIASTVATGIATAATWAFNAALFVLTSPITLIVLAIAALIAGIFLLVKNWDLVKETAANVWAGIVSIWNGVAEWFNTTVIQPLAAFFKGLWDGIVSIFSAVVGWFQGIFTAAWNGICYVFNAYWSFFSGVWNGIISIFSAVGSWFGGIFRGAWNQVTGAFSGVANFFGGLWNVIKEKFSSIGSVIGSAIGDAFKYVVNSIIGFAENTINGFIRAINGAIGLINKIPGVDIGKLGMLSIPKLAQGGYVGANQPQLAMIGDNRHEGEIVAPESKLQDAVNKAALLASQQSGGLTEAAIYRAVKKALAETDKDIYLDGKSVKDAVVTRINRSTRASGVCEINI